MPPAGSTGRNTARCAGAWGSALALVLLFCAGSVSAQWSRPPFPGSPPTKVSGGPDLTWNGNSWQVPQGGEIHWTITIPNDAVGVGVEIVLSDDLPDPVDGYPVLPFDLATDVLSRTPIGALSYTGDQLTWNNFILSLNETAEITFRTRITPAAAPGTLICNYGLVTYVEAEEGGPIGGVPQRWANVTLNADGVEEPECVVVASGVLLVDSSKTAADADADGWIEAGETVDFEILVRNTGSGDATAVTVTDTLPAGLTPIAAGQGGIITGDTISWDESTTPELARVRAGLDVSLTLQAIAECTDAATLCNQAFLSAAEIDYDVPTGDPLLPSPSQPTCLPAAYPILADSPLRLSDADGDGRYVVGELVNGEIVVTNRGTADAASVETRLPLPACLIEALPLDGGTLAGSEITWTSAGTPTLATIGVGASVTLRFQARIDPAAADGQSCCAQASFLPAIGCAGELTDDESTPAATDETCFSVAATPELVLRLVATDPDGNGVLAAGEIVEFELAVESLGGAPGADVAIELPLPVGLFESEEADLGFAAPNLLSWDASTVPALSSVSPGETVLLTGRATLTCAFVDEDEACLAAQLVASNLGAPLPSDDPAEPGASDPTCLSLSAPVLAGSMLEATEAGGDGAFERGEVISISLSFTNDGSATADDVLVELPLLIGDEEVTPDNGGRVDPDAVRWDAITTPELLALAPGASLQLGLTLRIAPEASGRACRQATLSWPAGGCASEVSHDPLLSGDDQPTCWDVVGTGEAPSEVPDGDPFDAGPVPVRLTCEGTDLLLEWEAAANATTHVVYRGPLSSFRDRPWRNPSGAIDDPENSSSSCDLLVLSYRDEGECAAGGEDFYFLVAGRNLIGEGPLGEMRRGTMLEERPPVVAPCP